MLNLQVRRIWFMVFVLGVFLTGCGRQQITPDPALTSIVPSSGTQGTSPTVVIMGANFANGSTISLSGTGITVSNVNVVSSSQITATFAIAGNAPVGPQNVTVTSQGRVSGPLPFTVVAAPTLTSITPNSGVQGQPPFAVVLRGTGFVSPATIAVSGTGVTASAITVVNATTINATFTISLTAAATVRNVTVTVGTPGATTNSVTFTVGVAVPAAPTIVFTNPANGATGVPTNNKITATFNKPMNAATITTASFTVTGPGGPVAAASVTCDSPTSCNSAIFQPAAALAPNTTFTALIGPTVTDTGGAFLVPGATNPWMFTTGAGPDNVSPVVTSTIPASGALNVPSNQTIVATFNKAMNPATINTTTFKLTGPGGPTPITGTVTYGGTTASFKPTSNLAAGVYTAQVTSGAQDLAGNALAAVSPVPNPWTFTVGTTTDPTPPTIILTNPVNNATGVPLNKAVNATFSKPMDPTTINSGTFTLAGPGVTPVNGVVTYDVASRIATFTPNNPPGLVANTTYTATVTSGAKDLAGNALTSGTTPNPWTFMTGPPFTGASPASVNLGTAGTFAVMARAATTATGTTQINGDVGLSPGTSQGIPPSQVNGTIHVNDPAIAQAQVDLLAAYTDVVGRTTGVQTLAGNLGGLTINPGLYKNSSSVMISGSGPNNNLTLDALGDPNAVFIFQIGSTLTTGPGAQVILAGGAKASNVFWQVGTSATLGTTTIFKGNILAFTTITVNTGSDVVGRLFAGSTTDITGAVTIGASTVTVPAP